MGPPGTHGIHEYDGANSSNLEEIGAAPWVLVGFLTVLGMAALVHALLRTVRARRIELGVLACIGFRPRDLRRIVTWQASGTEVAGVLVGLLLGAVAGRAAWRSIAQATGVVEDIALPVLAIFLAVPVALALSYVVALAARLMIQSAPAEQIRAD